MNRWESFSDFWAGKRVMITGHAGFVGSRLGHALYKAGATVYGVDYHEQIFIPYDAYFHERRGWFESVFMGDVRDRAEMEELVAMWRPEVIFHLAAISQVVDAIHAPVQTFETNIVGTANILDVARLCGFRPAVVVASSDKAYGKIADDKAHEYTPLDPYHPYDVSKAAADYVARSYAEIYEMPVAVTRCGNIYGPGDRNWQRLIPGVIRWLLKGETPIIRSDGTLRREYNYIDDILDAYLRVAEHVMEGGSSGISWTISDQRGYFNVMEVVYQIFEAVGREIEPIIEDGVPEEEKAIQLDASMIYERLGWQPRVEFEEGLRRTVIWIKGFLGMPLSGEVFYDPRPVLT